MLVHVRAFASKIYSTERMIRITVGETFLGLILSRPT